VCIEGRQLYSAAESSSLPLRECVNSESVCVAYPRTHSLSSLLSQPAPNKEITFRALPLCCAQLSAERERMKQDNDAVLNAPGRRGRPDTHEKVTSATTTANKRGLRR
jgi:hypothetical protein